MKAVSIFKAIRRAPETSEGENHDGDVNSKQEGEEHKNGS
jgi:hypothetical protein